MSLRLFGHRFRKLPTRTRPVTQRLAVYGTLRRADGMQEKLGVAALLRFERACVIPGRLIDLGAYPGLIEAEGRVPGELFQVLDPTAWPILDEYEGEEYERRRTVLLEPRAEAWVYVYRD